MLLGNKQQLAIWVLISAIAGGFMVFRYLPLNRKKEQLLRQKMTQRADILKALSEKQKLSLLKDRLHQLKSQVQNYELQIPEQRDLGVFLSRIADLMNEHRLSGQLIQPGKEKISGELICIPIDMRGKGRTTQIFDFYQSLQKLDRLIRIEEVKLLNDLNYSGNVSMQTKAVVFYRSDNKKG